MKIFKLTLVSLILGIVSGCGSFKNPLDTANWQKIERETYSLMVPDYMTEQSDLHEEANLQYAQLIKEVYVVVIEEPVADFESVFSDSTLGYPPTIQGYSDLMYEQFRENMGADLVNISERTIQKDVNLERHTFNSVSKVENVEAYYEFGLVRSADSYYQIIAWTLADRKEEYGAVLAQIVKSLQPKNAATAAQ